MSQPDQKKRRIVTISGTDDEIDRVYDFIANECQSRRLNAISNFHECANDAAMDTKNEDDIDDKSLFQIITQLEKCIQDLKSAMASTTIEIEEPDEPDVSSSP